MLHTTLNKSKNIVFHVNSPPCLVFAFYLLLASISSYFTALYIRSQSFLSHMQVPQFSLRFCNYFSVYFFSNLIMVRETLVSVCIQRNSSMRPSRLYDHLFINTIVFRLRRDNLRVILLFWRPLKCDHLAIMARSLWPKGCRINGVPLCFLISVFHLLLQKQKDMRQLDYGN